MDIEEYINEEKERALSDYDILKLLEGKANLLLYENIANMNSLDEMLGNHNACVILYQTKKHYGHWCCIFKQNNDLVEFFDPYGTYVDDELEYVPKDLKKQTNQDAPYLSLLMLESPYELSYNEHRFQKMKKGTNTCGRWCALRLLLRNLDLNEFTELFKREDGDNLVTLITELK